MMNRLLIVAVFLFSPFLIADVSAGEVLKSSGVAIRSGGWKVGNHADESYVVFKEIRKNKLAEYDYYYQLRVVPQFKVSFEECEESPDFLSFFQGILGTTESSLLLVRAGITYRWKSGKSTEFLKEAVPLFVAGTGIDPSTMKGGNGCFYDSTADVSFPLSRYNGGGEKQDFDDFSVKFIVESGEGLSLNAISTIKELFSQFNAAFSWTDITGARVAAYEGAAKRFQEAIVKSGNFKNSIAKRHAIKTQGVGSSRVVITIPNLFGEGRKDAGTLVIYARLVGSIALDTSLDEIRPSTILQSESLSSRQCSPDEIASGKCDTSSKTVRAGLRSLDKDSPVDLFDVYTNDGRNKIYKLCDEVRVFSSETLKLSTLDALLVRWAVAKSSGLLEAFNDKDKATSIAEATGRSVEEVRLKCWADDDERTLQAVAKKLGKTIN